MNRSNFTDFCILHLNFYCLLTSRLMKKRKILIFPGLDASRRFLAKFLRPWWLEVWINHWTGLQCLKPAKTLCRSLEIGIAGLALHLISSFVTKALSSENMRISQCCRIQCSCKILCCFISHYSLAAVTVLVCLKYYRDPLN